MLETEEVDDDYFTPIAKISLASIFKKPLTSDKPENESLKYSPPITKPYQNQDEPQAPKRPENIFSCVLDAYLWLNDVYTHRGKLGFALVKHQVNESLYFHTILLYDSKKATVSSATATKELEVTVKGKDFISYYDRYKKYWCLYGSEDDIKKITEILGNCNVTIKVLKESDDTVPKQNEKEIKTNTESDTDSSINRKTKASILSRMANMGQSVLPPRATSIEQTSDSTDSNESDNKIIAVKHKPTKNVVKKNVLEKNTLDQPQYVNTHNKPVVPLKPHSIENTCMVVSDQLMPMQGSNAIATTSGNDLNYFITEQRINNSEMRINISRVCDKVDNILSKVNNLDSKGKNEETTSNYINTEILQKLLKEYEYKIKSYEELLKVKNKSTETNISQYSHSTNELFDKNQIIMNDEQINLKNKIIELEKCTKEKDIVISALNNEIETLRMSNNLEKSKGNEGELEAKLSEYEEKLLQNQELLAHLTHDNEELLKSHNEQMSQKIKAIMNDTFRTIEINFENDETYLGIHIKNIIATVIKKVTIESLSKT